MYLRKIINLFKNEYTHSGEIYSIPKKISYPAPDISIELFKTRKIYKRDQDLLNFVKKLKKKKLTILDIGAGYTNIKNIIEKKTKKKFFLYVKETKEL